MEEIAAAASGLVRLATPSLLVSIAAVVLLRRVSSFARFAFVGALTMAFLVGYVALPDWARLIPDRHWHWLPYLAIAGALAGLIEAVETLGYGRHSATLIASCVAAWLLVPTWPALAPMRLMIIAGLSISLVALSFLLAALAKRLSHREFLAYSALASIAVAVCTAAAVSVQSGLVAGVLAASISGCCAATWTARVESKHLIAMIPCYAILAGGVTFVGFIEPDPPFFELLLIPFTPMAAWISRIGPFRRFDGMKAIALRCATVVTTLAIACGLALI